MVRAPQGEETLFEAHNLFVRFWQGNEARRLGSISSFTARRICAIPVDRGGLMSAVSAALLAMPPSRLSAQVPQRKAHKSRRDASYASIGEVCDRAGAPATVDALLVIEDKRELAVAQGSLSTAQEPGAVLCIAQYAANQRALHRLL